MLLEQLLSLHDRGDLQMFLELESSRDVERIILTRSDMDDKHHDYDVLRRFIEDMEHLINFLDSPIEEIIQHYDKYTLCTYVVGKLSHQIGECWLEENPAKQELQFLIFKENFEICKRLGLHHGNAEHLELFDPIPVTT